MITFSNKNKGIFLLTFMLLAGILQSKQLMAGDHPGEHVKITFRNGSVMEYVRFKKRNDDTKFLNNIFLIQFDRLLGDLEDGSGEIAVGGFDLPDPDRPKEKRIIKKMLTRIDFLDVNIFSLGTYFKPNKTTPTRVNLKGATLGFLLDDLGYVESYEIKDFGKTYTEVQSEFNEGTPMPVQDKKSTGRAIMIFNQYTNEWTEVKDDKVESYSYSHQYFGGAREAEHPANSELSSKGLEPLNNGDDNFFESFIDNAKTKLGQINYVFEDEQSGLEHLLSFLEKNSDSDNLTQLDRLKSFVIGIGVNIIFKHSQSNYKPVEQFPAELITVIENAKLASRVRDDSLVSGHTVKTSDDEQEVTMSIVMRNKGTNQVDRNTFSTVSFTMSLDHLKEIGPDLKLLLSNFWK